MISRPMTPKGLIDAADLHRLLLTFPELKTDEGSVVQALHRLDASGEALDAWRELVTQESCPKTKAPGSDATGNQRAGSG